MRKERLLWIGGRDSTRAAILAAVRRLDRLEFAEVHWLESASGATADDLSHCSLIVGEPRTAGEVAILAGIAQHVQGGGRSVACLALAPVYLAGDALALFRAGVSEYVESRTPEPELTRLIDRLSAEAVIPRTPPSACEVEQLVDSTTLTLPGISPAQKDQLRRIAGQDTTILLTGESGTGKGRLAELIHEWSPRRGLPIVVINCADYQTNDFELEVFGASRGSFPGLDHDIEGKFGSAGRGTIVLEGIEALSPSIQMKLLRAIEDRVYEPIGSHEARPLQARLIATSAVSLEDEARAGRFRTELFYRLNVVGFRLPPLRERRAAIQDLVFKFLSDAAAEEGIPTITAEAIRSLEHHDWPGNIRELRAIIANALTRCRRRVVSVEDLPAHLASAEPANPADAPVPAADPARMPEHLSQAMENAELARIMRALEQEQNNRMRTARALGISRVTLYKKLEKYGLLRKEGAVMNG